MIRKSELKTKKKRIKIQLKRKKMAKLYLIKSIAKDKKISLNKKE